MGLFSKVFNFLSGGLGEKIADKVLSQFPSKVEKAKIKAAIIEASREQELELLKLVQEEEKLALQEVEKFRQSIKDLEGTAKDLQQFGIIGKIIVFLRGCQRPIWGFGILYGDYMIFSGEWNPADIATKSNGSLDLEAAFWIINFIVLTFLFGERAVKNAAPVVKDMLKGWRGSGPTT